jgi:hypothetical protein
VVLVEGDDDTRLYAKFVLPAPHARLLFCEGKPLLLQAMEILDGRGVNGVVGICDADFDRVTGFQVRNNVVLTDHRDAEVSILFSDAFRHVHGELMSAAGSPDYSLAVAELRDTVIDLAVPIGNLRVENHVNQLRLNFKALAPAGYVASDGSFDVVTYIGDLLDASAGSLATLEELLEVAEGVPAATPSQLVSGHDVAALLDTVTARLTGRSPLGHEVVEAMLRLAYDPAIFSRSDLARALVEWEQRANLEVLREEACP